MSQLDKLIEDILRLDPNVRFEELYKVLVRLGYTPGTPRSGSSHYTFRKPGCMPITIPKKSPVNKAYISIVADAIRADLEEDSQ